VNRASIVAILAAAGIVFSGALTTDTVALARAIVAGDTAGFQLFVRQYPDSPLAAEAMRLAVKGSKGLQGTRHGVDRSPYAR
jgi:hypothetical protein